MGNKNEILQKLIGPIFTIFTPFNQDLNIDYKALDAYIEHLYFGGARNFYVMAYNSRYSQLTFSEIFELNKFCILKVKSLNKENLIIVGDPIHCSTDISIEFAKSAEETGGDAISLIIREKYFSNDQILNHFKFVAEKTKIGIVVHEMPFLSGQDVNKCNG